MPAPFLSSYPVISFPHIIRILSVGFRIIQFSLACCPLHVRSALEHSLFVCDSSVLLSAAILPGTLSRLIILQSGSYLHVEYIQSVRCGRESAAILAEQEMGMRLTGVTISLPYRRVPRRIGPPASVNARGQVKVAISSWRVNPTCPMKSTGVLCLLLSSTELGFKPLTIPSISPGHILLQPHV